MSLVTSVIHLHVGSHQGTYVDDVFPADVFLFAQIQYHICNHLQKRYCTRAKFDYLSLLTVAFTLLLSSPLQWFLYTLPVMLCECLRLGSLHGEVCYTRNGCFVVNQ